MFDTMLSRYLPQLTPLIIGLAAFVVGLFFALRERRWWQHHYVELPRVKSDAA